MKKWLKRIALVAVVLVVVSVVWVAIFDAGIISVHYADTANIQHQRIRQGLESWRGFDAAAAELDSAFLLPSDLQVWFADCGAINAFYNPDNQQVVLCYELVDDLIRAYSRYTRLDSALSAAVWQTIFFVFYHEIGHALIHILDLPTTGREEDVVDQLATLVLLRGGDAGRDAALQGASWFWINSRTRGRRTPFWDEHSLDQQRYYNILCWVYGSAPEAHQPLLTRNWGLTRERADRCQPEFARMSRAWQSVLEEHTY